MDAVLFAYAPQDRQKELRLQDNRLYFDELATWSFIQASPLDNLKVLPQTKQSLKSHPDPHHWHKNRLAFLGLLIEAVNL